MPNRKLLRVGLPLRLDQLKTLLASFDDETAIVKTYNGELIVERPDPQLTEEE